MKKLKPQRVDWRQIDRFLQSAEKKLVSARKILAFDEEACLQQAYEAMLKASLGFMFSHGFRARSQPGHHIAIIEFVRARIDKKAEKTEAWRTAGSWGYRSRQSLLRPDGPDRTLTNNPHPHIQIEQDFHLDLDNLSVPIDLGCQSG